MGLNITSRSDYVFVWLENDFLRGKTILKDRSRYEKSTADQYCRRRDWTIRKKIGTKNVYLFKNNNKKQNIFLNHFSRL